MNGALLSLLLLGSAHARPVSLTTEDGVKLAGDTVGSGTVGVLLIHDTGRSASDWGRLADKLASKGMRVLTVDLRGHGASVAPASKKTAEADESEAADEDHFVMVKDVAAGAQWLTRAGSREVLAVGAGVGANLAMTAAAFDNGIDGVAMLSPTMRSKGVKVSTALRSYGTRPLLLAADENDPVLARAAYLIERDARGPTDVALYPRAGAGTRMLNAVPDLEGRLVGWLSGSWKAEAAEQERNARSSEVDDIETKGTKLEDRN